MRLLIWLALCAGGGALVGRAIGTDGSVWLALIGLTMVMIGHHFGPFETTKGEVETKQ